MEQKYDSFPQATKAIITQYGEDVINDIRFLNILSDIYSIDTIPGAKNILRKILSDGYGRDILFASKTDMWEVKLKMLGTKLVSENGFREDVSSYIIDSFIFGLALCDKMPEPMPSSAPISEIDMTLELRKMKNDYLAMLEEKMVVPEGKSGYYPTNAKSDIYELKNKIILLARTIEKDESQWCEAKLNEMKEKYYVEPPVLQQKGFFKRLFG